MRENLLLVLVGDGPERVNLEAHVAQRDLSDSVVFLGHQDDVAGILSELDVFVLPSFSEGLSNTLIEALASGVPCIASRVGGNAEIIRDGLDGMLFESNDLAALTDCIARLCRSQDVRTDVGARGRDRVRACFSLDAMLVNYQNMYEQVLGRQ